MAKEDRGFASMDRGKQREIASKGGKAAHRRAPRTSGRARRRVKRAAKAGWRAIAASRSRRRRVDGIRRAADCGHPNPEQMMGTDNLP